MKRIPDFTGGVRRLVCDYQREFKKENKRAVWKEIVEDYLKNCDISREWSQRTVLLRAQLRAECSKGECSSETLDALVSEYRELASAALVKCERLKTALELKEGGKNYGEYREGMR